MTLTRTYAFVTRVYPRNEFALLLRKKTFSTRVLLPADRLGPAGQSNERSVWQPKQIGRLSARTLEARLKHLRWLLKQLIKEDHLLA